MMNAIIGCNSPIVAGRSTRCLKEKIIGLNAEAAHWLCQGQLRRSTLASLGALQHAKTLLADPRTWIEPHSTANDRMEGHTDSLALSFLETEPKTFSTVQIPIQCPITEGMFPMYDQFLLMKDLTTFDSLFACNDDIISCLLLYNIGLSLHLEGIYAGKDMLLVKATGAYDSALNLLTGMTEPCGPDSVLLLLAIMNNLASLQEQRFNSVQANHFSKLICEILDNPEFTDMLADAAFDFFVLYLFLVPNHMMCHSSAPAA